jgi:threonine/homoserine/homoserine lactone efflux protein
MAAGSVVAFWAVALLLIMVPGADWAFVLGASLRGRSVLPAVAGLMLGYAGITVVVAAGVGAIVSRSPALFATLTVVGGCYLIWHGATTVARPSAPPPAGTAAPAQTPSAGTAAPTQTPSAGTAAPTQTPSAGTAAPTQIPSAGTAAPTQTPSAGTGRSVLVRGLGVSALNPKGLLIFLALLPQFTNPRWSWPLTAQLGLLGLVFAATCGAFYLGLGSAARKVLATRPTAARAVTRFSGAAMLVIGALLLAWH